MDLSKGTKSDNETKHNSNIQYNFVLPTECEITESDLVSPYKATPISGNLSFVPSIKKINSIVLSDDKRTGKPYRMEPELFYMQAKYMVGFKGDGRKHEEVPFEREDKPAYSVMTLTQKQWYFTWRTDVRSGTVNKTAFPYIHLYISELINLVGVDDASDAFQKIAAFWLEYRKHDRKKDEFFRVCLVDLYICYDFNETFYELISNLGIKKFYPNASNASKKLNSIYNNLFQISNYKINKSKFNSLAVKNIEKCFIKIINSIDSFFYIQGISIENLYKNLAIKRTSHTPFRRYAYLERTQIKKSVCIAENEFYEFDGFEWTCFSQNHSLCNPNFSYFIGYILKKIESEIEILSGKIETQPLEEFEYNPLYSWSNYQNDQQFGRDFFQKIISDSHLDVIIKETVRLHFTEPVNYETLITKPEQKLYQTLIEMRKIKEHDITEKFCKQANLLHNISYISEEKAVLDSRSLSFDEMKDDQIRTYLSWRTKYKSEIIEDISISGIALYTCEIINKIEGQDTWTVTKKLSDLLHAYAYWGILEKYLITLIRDYYICNPGNHTFYELALENNLQIYYPHLFFGDNNLKDPFSFYKKLSFYDIEKSAFYNAKTKPLLKSCFKKCLKKVFIFLKNRNIDYKNIFAIKTKCNKRFEVFNDSIYRFKENIPKEKVVKICNKEIYEHYKDAVWTQKSFARLDIAANHLIGYIMKVMEGAARQVIDFKPYKILHPLNINVETMARRINSKSPNKKLVAGLITNSELKKLIEETTTKYFQKNHEGFSLNYWIDAT